MANFQMKLLILDQCASLGVATYRRTVTTELALKVYFVKNNINIIKLSYQMIMGTDKRTILINVKQYFLAEMHVLSE